MNEREESFGKKVDKHIQRWLELSRNPASVPTNVQMGEDAVKQIYRRYLGKAPSAVVWCESPFQFAVLPAVVVNVLDGAGREGWKKLLLAVNAKGSAGSPEWEAAWKAEWPHFAEQTLGPVVHHIASHPTLRKQSDAAMRRLEQDAALTLHRLALANPFATWAIFDEKSRRNHKNGYGMPPTEFTCIKGALRLQQRLSEWLNVSAWTWPMSAGMAVGLGVWDPRVIKKIVPVAEKLFGPEVRANLPVPQMTYVGVAHEKCRELEELYGRVLNFWVAMAYEPRRDPPLDLPPDGNLMRNVGSAIGQTVAREWSRRNREPQTPNVATGFAIWLPYHFGWIPFALACRFLEPDPLSDMATEIDDWGYLARAAMACNFTKHIAFLMKKPVSMTFNENDRIHNQNGPAIVWGDGSETYVWKGITVDRALIMEPEKITHRDITNEINTEIRRVLIDLYGDARYLRDAGAKKVHEDETGILYRTELPGDEALVMVKVKNSTPEPDGTFKYYYLRVPPNTMRAKEGVAWTFGVDEKDYHPSFQS